MLLCFAGDVSETSEGSFKKRNRCRLKDIRVRKRAHLTLKQHALKL